MGRRGACEFCGESDGGHQLRCRASAPGSSATIVWVGRDEHGDVRVVVRRYADRGVAPSVYAERATFDSMGDLRWVAIARERRDATLAQAIADLTSPGWVKP